MQPKITITPTRKLIGMSLETSLIENKTMQLFKAFMPRKKEVQCTVNKAVFDIRIYSPDYYKKFNPAAKFTKWAAVEVSIFEEMPDGMKPMTLPSGQYAVFTIKSVDSNPSFFQYIFMEWLPNSNYLLDSRPHFDILGEGIQQRLPDAEEEIWIPIQEKM